MVEIQRSSQVDGAAGAPAPAEPPTVLVVDDSADFRCLLRLHLERDGFRVIEARSGQHALALALRFGPSVVVTDIAMTAGDGYELMARISKVLPQLPVIVVSSLDRPVAQRSKLGAAAVTVPRRWIVKRGDKDLGLEVCRTVRWVVPGQRRT